MSIPLPLRSIRITALHRQCLFHGRPRRLHEAFAAPAIRAFSSTPSHAKSKDDAVIERIMGKAQVETTMWSDDETPAPAVSLEKGKKTENAVAPDIGLLQNTIVRAPLRKLPHVWEKKLWQYYWVVIKSKISGLWSRSGYKRCIQKRRWTRHIPIDMWKNKLLQERAKRFYVKIYQNYTAGSLRPLEPFCLPRVLRELKARAASRGPYQIEWAIKKWKSVRIVSHRAAYLGEDFPDSAFRQVVVRLESMQSISVRDRWSASATEQDASNRRSYHTKTSQDDKAQWKPRSLKQERKERKEPKESKKSKNIKVQKPSPPPRNNTTEKKVVEYIVMQRRVFKGIESEWKVWGFTQESTPESIEKDEEYFKNTLNTLVADGE